MANPTCRLISFLSLLVSALLPGLANAQDTSATWQSCIQFYQQLDRQSENGMLIELGKSDQGRPIHCFVINKDKVFDPDQWNSDKIVVLINNNIHPGEPDGVEASMRLCQAICTQQKGFDKILDRVILAVIPMYNVDGAEVRGRYFRANQNGPVESGFRGNALNLDLNRDFIKCDSQNALVFSRWFTRIQPHIMVDTHVSNGADYAYTMTLITTQSDKLGYVQGHFVRNEMEPVIFERMEKTDYPMSPYVHTMGRTPESGIEGFLETARFATGYAALFGTIGFTTETHMLKPFQQRVNATYVFFEQLLQLTYEKHLDILHQYAEGRAEMLAQDVIPLHFELDTSARGSISFKGYQALEEPALFGSGQRLRYDRSSAWKSPIPYYSRYTGTDHVKVPDFYVVPAAWRHVLERLDANRVDCQILQHDTAMHVRVSYADQFETAKQPYEGHYYHFNMHMRDTVMLVQFHAGDRIIPTRQWARRFLVQALEPASEEGYFAWNFFDSMLQQKEWFSDYVFEEIAAELLKTDAQLQRDFDAAMKADRNLAEDHWSQLYWVYKHSPYYERTAFRIPVFRITTPE